MLLRSFGEGRPEAHLTVDAELRRLLKQQGFEQSMSRADETYDNAYAESLFSRYKAELLEDGALVDKLKRAPRLYKIWAYAGWKIRS